MATYILLCPILIYTITINMLVVKQVVGCYKALGVCRPNIVSVWKSICVCVCVYPLPRPLITSGMMWHDIDLLNKFHSCYMAIVVSIVNGRGLGIDTHYEN